MSASLPEILGSKALNYERFPSAIVPGVYCSYSAPVNSEISPSSEGEEEKKFGVVRRVENEDDIQIGSLEVPNELSAHIKAQIPPLRLSTTKHVPELVKTCKTTIIKHHQIRDLIYVFHHDQVKTGEVSITGMEDYYLLRYSISTSDNRKIIPITSFASFPSQHAEYELRFWPCSCIPSQLHSLRMEIKQYMTSILNTAKMSQGTGSDCKQTKYYPSFGISKWQLLLYVIRKYSSIFTPAIHKKNRKQRYAILKPTYALCTQRRVVTAEYIYFQYPQEFQLLVRIFGDTFLRGMRKKPPKVDENDLLISHNDQINRLVCHFTCDEGKYYYNNHCPWPGRDPQNHYVRFSFDGLNQMSIVVRYASTVVKDHDICHLQQSSLEIPSGNISEIDYLVGTVSVNVGQMFAVPPEDEVFPYNQFEEIDWCVQSISGDKVICIILDPPLAKQRCPESREFDIHVIKQYIAS